MKNNEERLIYLTQLHQNGCLMTTKELEEFCNWNIKYYKHPALEVPGELLLNDDTRLWTEPVKTHSKLRLEYKFDIEQKLDKVYNTIGDFLNYLKEEDLFETFNESILNYDDEVYSKDEYYTSRRILRKLFHNWAMERYKNGEI